jgi:hypothetical protein
VREKREELLHLDVLLPAAALLPVGEGDCLRWVKKGRRSAGRRRTTHCVAGYCWMSGSGRRAEGLSEGHEPRWRRGCGGCSSSAALPTPGPGHCAVAPHAGPAAEPVRPRARARRAASPCRAPRETRAPAYPILAAMAGGRHAECGGSGGGVCGVRLRLPVGSQGGK